MGEVGSEMPVGGGGGGGGGGEVAKCQRSHEWDIESISFMFNTHMDEESNWRCGGLFRQVTEHRRPQENPWKERQSVCMLALCLDACVSKQVYGFICPPLSCVSLHLHIFPIAARIIAIPPISTTVQDSGVFLGSHQWRDLFICFVAPFSLSILWHGLVYSAAPLVKKQWLLEGVSRHSFNKWEYLEWAVGPEPLRQM